MKVLGWCKSFAVTFIFSTFCSTAFAASDKPIKIGVVAPFSGVFANIGKQVQDGITVYMNQHGDTVAGRKVEILYRDNVGPDPVAAKRLSQELVAREEVDILAGYIFTPDAFAAAPVATAGKTPMFVLLAGTSSVTDKSPYIIRTSYTIPQMALPLGQWAAKNGIRRVVTLVADYAPGHDGEKWFKKGYEENGGIVVDELRVPPFGHDFSAYLKRAKDSKPDAIFAFVPGGEPTILFMKNYDNSGLAKEGIKVIATEGWADDETLRAVGNAAIDTISSGFYTTDHDSEMNRQFVKDALKVNAKVPPNYITVAAYDAMQVIYKTIASLNGDVDGDKIIEAAKGLKIESPRGVLLIDPETRDAVHDVYIRKVERVGDVLVNRNFDKMPMVADPGK